jgi:hypothetical protein
MVDAQQEQADSTQELYDRGGVHWHPFVGRSRAPKPCAAPVARSTILMTKVKRFMTAPFEMKLRPRPPFAL